MDRDIRHDLPLLSGTPDTSTGHRPLVTGHCSRRFQLALAWLLTLLVPCAFATPYEVIYDANTDGVFPEDLGWERQVVGEGAHRAAENGIFTLEAQNPSPDGGSDQYHWDAMETLNQDLGEMFYAEWRVCVLPGSNSSDVGVYIATDGMQRAFNLAYNVAFIHSSRDDRFLLLDTTVYRTYRLESLDMIDYRFYVGDELAWDGFFGLGTTRTSEIRFGDFLGAAASSSQWDYFRFGVTPVPAPNSIGLLILGGIASVRWRKRAARLPIALFALTAALAPPAAATPYEVLYDANVDGVFPEDLGWERWTTGGGVSRTIQDGIFTLAAINPPPNGGSDQYRWDGMEMLNAGLGEMFYAEWHMRLLPGSDTSDVGVFLATDGMARAFSFAYTDHSIYSSRDNRRLDIDTTISHVYRIESFDMVNYTMYVDAIPAWEGFFGLGTTRSSEVFWGDQLVGSASASEWNYFKFGVIPEPDCFLVLATVALAIPRRRGIASRSSMKEELPCAESPYS